jgi:hypothetical protein
MEEILQRVLCLKNNFALSVGAFNISLNSSIEVTSFQGKEEIGADDFEKSPMLDSFIIRM